MKDPLAARACFMAAILIVMWGQSFDSIAHAFRGAGVGDRRTLRSRSICSLLMGHFGPRRRVAHLIDKGRTQDSGSRIARGVRCPELGWPHWFHITSGVQ